MTTIARSRHGHWAARPDFAPRQLAPLEPVDSQILNLTNQIELLTEAHRACRCPNERREILDRRWDLQIELRARRLALHPKPVSVSFFRRFIAALLTR